MGVTEKFEIRNWKFVGVHCFPTDDYRLTTDDSLKAQVSAVSKRSRGVSVGASSGGPVRGGPPLIRISPSGTGSGGCPGSHPASR